MYLETTEIAARKSAGEVQEILGEAGANRVMMCYGAGRGIESLSFTLLVAGREIAFRLPIRVGSIRAVLRADMKRPQKGWEKRLDETAERIAWRQVLYWLKAQLALIDTGMVQPAEVFMPYAQLGDGRTLFEEIESKGYKSLPEPKRE